MTMVGEKTMSTMKKKGLGSRSQLMRMHLAVYPFQVQFLNNVDYPSAFYFQKNYQLIGQMKGIVPTGEKKTKLPLGDINNIIHFRLYSPSNVVYKWSVYRKENGEEQFIDSCTLNLKEAVNSYLGPQKSIGLGSHNSILELGFVHKEMQLKFPKMGVILSFVFYMAVDTAQIYEHVQRHMIDNIDEEQAMPHTTLLRTDSGNLQHSSNARFKNNNSQSLYKIKSSDPIMATSSVDKLQENSVEKEEQGISKQEDNIKEEPQDNLENLIMSFDIDGNLNEPIKFHRGPANTTKPPEPEQKLRDQIFKEDFTSSKRQEKAEEEDEAPKEDKPSDGRDYGMLKLQSDQGRIRQEMIDKKLQLEELEAIEEEKPSREYTINQTISQANIRTARSANTSTPLARSIKEQSQENEVSTVSKFNVKKIAVVFVLSIFLFVVAATLSKKIHRRRSVQRHRRE